MKLFKFHRLYLKYQIFENQTSFNNFYIIIIMVYHSVEQFYLNCQKFNLKDRLSNNFNGFNLFFNREIDTELNR